MNKELRRTLVAVLLLPVSLLTVLGIHRFSLDGGYGKRTAGNHDSAVVYLVAAAAAVLLGVVGAASTDKQPRLALSLLILALLVAMAGLVIGGEVHTSGLNCACEGG